MSGVNAITLVGRLGQDPEVRFINDREVCNFSVATSERWKDKNGERKERTEWHNVAVWGKQAQSCGEYLMKGSLVGVQGKLQSREWAEKDTGTKRKSWEILASSVSFLGSKPEAEQSPRPTMGRIEPVKTAPHMQDPDSFPF